MYLTSTDRCHSSGCSPEKRIGLHSLNDSDLKDLPLFLFKDPKPLVPRRSETPFDYIIFPSP